MQKFLVGPGIGGAAISLGAVKYLVRTCGEGLDPVWEYMNTHPDEKVDESNGEVGFVSKDLFSPLLTEWWRLYRMGHHSDRELAFEDIADEAEISFLYGEYNSIRDSLIPFVERLKGQYDVLDMENGDTPLRIVEVPDGYFCGVVDDPETGCEVVEEYPRIWHARYDGEYRCLAELKKFCWRDASDTSWLEEDKVYELGHARVAFHGDYGVAQCHVVDRNDSYLFLRKNEYHHAVGDRPKVVFEVRDEHESRLPFTNAFRDIGEVETYARLVALLTYRNW